MRPVGLRDPHTGKRPYAVVQLRQDNLAGSLYNLVGFQTNLKYPEQKRVLRLIPGLENAELLRYGQMHRNTFIASPKLLRPTLQHIQRDDLFFAGQITGVEGYMGNIATGLLAGINAARFHQREEQIILPRTTMLGALCHYITHADLKDFQPMKANFGILPMLEDTTKTGRRERGKMYAERALADLSFTLSVLTEGHEIEVWPRNPLPFTCRSLGSCLLSQLAGTRIRSVRNRRRNPLYSTVNAPTRMCRRRSRLGHACLGPRDTRKSKNGCKRSLKQQAGRLKYKHRRLWDIPSKISW
jgi:hypothetical protein